MTDAIGVGEIQGSTTEDTGLWRCLLVTPFQVAPSIACMMQKLEGLAKNDAPEERDGTESAALGVQFIINGTHPIPHPTLNEIKYWRMGGRCQFETTQCLTHVESGWSPDGAMVAEGSH